MNLAQPDRLVSKRLWLHWTLANAWGELVGLGAVAGLGYLVASRLGESSSAVAVIALAAVFVALGAVEGFVVGLAQQQVLRRALPAVSGWVRATVIGAVAAWAIGMLPSTVMSMVAQAPGGSPPAISDWQRLLLAAGLGLVAGPMLAFFQWRQLRVVVPHAWLWLPANALAWAVGMPVIFAAAHAVAQQRSWQAAVATVGLALALAGALVGAVHGGFLAWLIRQGAATLACQETAAKSSI